MIKNNKKLLNALLISLLVLTVVFLVACVEEDKYTVGLTLLGGSPYELNDGVLKNVAGAPAAHVFSALVRVSVSDHDVVYVIRKKQGYTETDDEIDGIVGNVHNLPESLGHILSHRVLDGFPAVMVDAVPAVAGTSLAVPEVRSHCAADGAIVECFLSVNPVVPFDADLDLPEITTTPKKIDAYVIAFKDEAADRAAVEALGLTATSSHQEIADAVNYYVSNAQGFELELTVDSVVAELPGSNQ